MAGPNAEPPAPVTARGRGRPRDPAADAAILAAALELFIANGVDGTSIEQVAKRAGVARLTVYRRWPAKEDLLVQAIEAGRAEFADDDLVLALADGDAATPAGALNALADVWTRALTEPRNTALLARLIGCAADHPGLLAAYWHAHLVPRRDRAAPVIRALTAAGLLPEGTDPDVLLDVIAGAVVYRVLVNPEPISRDELRDRLFAVLRQSGAQLPS